MPLSVAELERLPFVTTGPVPLVKVDGLESYFIRDGVVFSRYFTVEPMLLQRVADFSPFRPLVKRISLQLIVERAVQEEMRRQVMEALRQTAMLATVSAMLTG